MSPVQLLPPSSAALSPSAQLLRSVGSFDQPTAATAYGVLLTGCMAAFSLSADNMTDHDTPCLREEWTAFNAPESRSACLRLCLTLCCSHRAVCTINRPQRVLSWSAHKLHAPAAAEQPAPIHIQQLHALHKRGSQSSATSQRIKCVHLLSAMETVPCNTERLCPRMSLGAVCYAIMPGSGMLQFAGHCQVVNKSARHAM
jgi:hypothetical protein